MFYGINAREEMPVNPRDHTNAREMGKSRCPAHRAGHLDSKEVSITLARLDPAYKAGLTACILLSDSEMREAIIYGGSISGKSTLMPPFEKTLTTREINDLVRYLRKLCSCI